MAAEMCSPGEGGEAAGGQHAVCWEGREATVRRKGQARLWREDRQAKGLGQDAGGNREQQGRAELDFTANTCCALTMW